MPDAKRVDYSNFVSSFDQHETPMIWLKAYQYMKTVKTNSDTLLILALSGIPLIFVVLHLKLNLMKSEI